MSAAAAKFRRDSLFCPDELDSLFSYFDTGSGPRSKSTTRTLHTSILHLQDYYSIIFLFDLLHVFYHHLPVMVACV